MTAVDQEYRRALALWSGPDRVRRTASLLTEMRKMLANRLVAEEPNLDDEALARGVAECLYRTDPRTQRLLSLLDE